jgi:hypothetical protein
MSTTNSSFLGMVVVAILKATTFDRCSMTDTNISHYSLIGTPLVAATLFLRAMCDTHSFLLCLIGTPLKATTFDRCSMRNAYSSFNGLIVTPLVAATLQLCSMRDADSHP